MSDIRMLYNIDAGQMVIDSEPGNLTIQIADIESQHVATAFLTELTQRMQKHTVCYISSDATGGSEVMDIETFTARLKETMQ